MCFGIACLWVCVVLLWVVLDWFGIVTMVLVCRVCLTFVFDFGWVSWVFGVVGQVCLGLWFVICIWYC